MEVTMDVLMFLHLWVAPVLLGISITAFTMVASHCKYRWQFMLAIVLFWITLGLFFYTVDLHISYQTTYCS